jgi:hypothetical protein
MFRRTESKTLATVTFLWRTVRLSLEKAGQLAKKNLMVGVLNIQINNFSLLLNWSL